MLVWLEPASALVAEAITFLLTAKVSILTDRTSTGVAEHSRMERNIIVSCIFLMSISLKFMISLKFSKT